MRTRPDDICACGDYRSDHLPRGGACEFGTHGIPPNSFGISDRCEKFRRAFCCDVHAMAPEEGHHEGCPANPGSDRTGRLEHTRVAAALVKEAERAEKKGQGTR